MVTHLALNEISLVRFQLGVPNINALCDATVVTAAAGEDKKPKCIDGLIQRSVFLFDNTRFVYRLGHQVFNLRRGVQLPYRVPIMGVKL